ncbi:MAG: hypothetical protein KA886_01395, partial [Candidatus Cloacimonetes bacterium]|nr:hypothetical protein [Candidatus Cloacimonadota bacterium]
SQAGRRASNLLAKKDLYSQAGSLRYNYIRTTSILSLFRKLVAYVTVSPFHSSSLSTLMSQKQVLMKPCTGSR